MSQAHRILNRVPSRDTQQDWNHEHAVSALVLPPNDATRPLSRDLRDPRNWPVGDQGDSGSCVGWATANGVLRWMHARASKIHLDQPLSPRFTWMSAKETDEFRSQPTTFIELEGTSLKAACKVCVKFGAVFESALPFGSARLFQGDTESFYASAARLKAQSYFNLSKAPKSTWRQWITTHGPILIGMEVDETWDNAGPATLEEFRPETVRGRHAVAIVGYNLDGFIVRNSWGQSWGDGGFAHVADKYASAAFSEAYGILV